MLKKAPMKNFRVTIKPKFFDEPRQGMTTCLKPDTSYDVVAAMGNTLLLRIDEDQLLEMYPRWCLFSEYYSPEIGDDL
jgi:hypothetical protein